MKSTHTSCVCVSLPTSFHSSMHVASSSVILQQTQYILRNSLPYLTSTRAAGEVLQYGQYSTASDVYCYSVLVWWVFNAFDVTRREQKVQSDVLYPLEKIPESEVYENVNLAYHRPLLSKPASCPAHIYHRMKECWQSERHERPYMPMLEAYMTLCEPEVAPESIGRESGTFMDVEIFSEPSDLDSLSSYADIDDDGYQYTRVANPSRSVSKISEGEEFAYDHLPEESDIYSLEKIYDDAACGGVNTQAHYLSSSEIHRMQSKEQVSFGEFDEIYITRDGEPENSKQNVTPSPPKQKPPVAPKPRMTLAGPQQVTVGRDGTSAHLPPPPSPAALSLYMVPGRGVTAKDGTRLQLPPPPPPSSGENDASGEDDCYLPLSGHTPSETTTVNDQDLVLSTKEHSRDDVCLNTPPPLPPRTHMHKLSQTTNETAGRAGMAGRSTRGTADRLLKLPTRPPPPPPPQSLQPPTVQQNSTDPPPLPPRPNLRCPSLRSASPAVYHNNNPVGAAGNRESAEFPVYEDLQ